MQRKMEHKNQVRNKYRRIRNNLTVNETTQWSEEICKRLISTELFQKAEVIYFYYPLGNEVNLLKATEEALRQGKIVAFPKTEGNEIHFYQVEKLDDFKEGCFHVMEPLSDKELTVSNPCMLIPGLVFDMQKNRMGYGKGYYDRYIISVPNAVKIGVAYELQIGEEIPVDDHDVSMDYILTEIRVY